MEESKLLSKHKEEKANGTLLVMKEVVIQRGQLSFTETKPSRLSAAWVTKVAELAKNIRDLSGGLLAGEGVL